MRALICALVLALASCCAAPVTTTPPFIPPAPLYDYCPYWQPTADSYGARCP